MGLLDQLWDDTVAGPRPESGLGKLRKHSKFSFSSSSGKESEGTSIKSYGDDVTEDAIRVTRSIMIVKPHGNNQNGSPPFSPSGSTPPVSPFAGSGGREAYLFRRRSASFAYEKQANGTGPRSPAPTYDV